jgi:hypothetical protein
MECAAWVMLQAPTAARPPVALVTMGTRARDCRICINRLAVTLDKTIGNGELP